MTPQDPAPRTGPHPLGLHLARHAAVAGSAPAALEALAGGGATWAPELQDEAVEFARDAADADAAGLRAALAFEAAERQRELFAGIAAYQAHPYRRTLAAPPAVWREGTARLLDYGTGGTGPAMLLVPSLVNRFHVLDLMEGRSLARFLAAENLHPFVLDWGTPGPEEAGFDVSCYVARRLEPALVEVARRHGPVVLAGYCMGGLAALAAALRRPREVGALALLATPWDFRASGNAAPALAALLEAVAPGDGEGLLPPSHLHAFFSLLDAARIARKFRAFGKRAPDDPDGDVFVAVEDWLNDGVPLALPAARECFRAWYGANLPGRGLWAVNGEAVEPARWTGPTLVAVPARDRIVPPASAEPLGEAIPGARLVRVPSGHVGMVTGTRAPEGLWRPLARLADEAAGRAR